MKIYHVREMERGEAADGAALEKDLERALAHRFATTGWQISRSSRPGEPDLIVAKDELRYVVEIKAARDGRRALLEGRMADAALRASAYARRLGSRTRPLAIVAAPVLSEAMVGGLREYAREFMPDMAFGLVDARGRYEFHGEGLDGLVGDPVRPLRRPEAASPSSSDLFSDLNQWMLKVLLGRHLPMNVLKVPRGPIYGASDLARLAATSVPSAWRFLSALTAAGFAEESPAGVELVRREELMEAWLSAVRRPVRERRAALTFPVDEPLEVLGPRVAAYRSMDRPIAWGTFVAAARLGHEFVRGAPLHLYVDDIGLATLERLELVAAAEHEPAHVILRKPRWPESFFRAAIDRNGQPSADVIQCWLDVSQHPARGAEQGAVLWRRVLGPALGIDARGARPGER